MKWEPLPPKEPEPNPDTTSNTKGRNSTSPDNSNTNAITGAGGNLPLKLISNPNSVPNSSVLRPMELRCAGESLHEFQIKLKLRQVKETKQLEQQYQMVELDLMRVEDRDGGRSVPVVVLWISMWGWGWMMNQIQLTCCHLYHLSITSRRVIVVLVLLLALVVALALV